VFQIATTEMTNANTVVFVRAGFAEAVHQHVHANSFSLSRVPEKHVTVLAVSDLEQLIVSVNKNPSTLICNGLGSSKCLTVGLILAPFCEEMLCEKKHNMNRQLN
jgi:hypothetical protein